jgi:hypothetical protein
MEGDQAFQNTDVSCMYSVQRTKNTVLIFALALLYNIESNINNIDWGVLNDSNTGEGFDWQPLLAADNTITQPPIQEAVPEGMEIGNVCYL